MNVKVISLLVLLLAVARLASATTSTTPFDLGEAIVIECKSSAEPTAEFTPALTCSQTGQPLSFPFGTQTFTYCGWHIHTQELYDFVSDIIQQKKAWICRVPMSKDKQFYIPLNIPLWGVVEPTHMHINYHMNFVFHVDDNRITGAAVYPVRDRFQYAKVGSLLNLHGPVRWFKGHSFKTEAEAIAEASSPISNSTVELLGWCVLTAVCTILVFMAVYAFFLRPRLLKKFLKSD